MSRTTLGRAACALLFVALAGCGKSEPDAQAKTEMLLKPFEGNWSVVSLDRGGKASPAAGRKEATAIVEKEKFMLIELKGPASEVGGVVVRNTVTEMYTLQVDPAKAAGEVDFVHASGEQIGQTRPGIYAFEGNRLKVCLGAVGAPRPTDFAATSKTTLMVLERKP